MTQIIPWAFFLVLLTGCDDAKSTSDSDPDPDDTSQNTPTDVADTTAPDGSDTTPPDGSDTPPPDVADTTAPDVAETTPPDGSDTTTADVADTTTNDVANDVPNIPTCPEGPLTSGPGTDVGDKLADLVFADCDGNPVNLHAFCGRPLHVNFFAGWCPPCRTHAAAAAANFASLPAGSQWLFVITENANGSVPSAAYCQSIRDAYGLTMPVVVDTLGIAPDHLGVSSPNSWYFVFDSELRLAFKSKFDQGAALDFLRTLAP